MRAYASETGSEDHTKRRLRVCAYARVSTDKDDQANSYENQVRYFTEFIQNNPEWIFTGVYSDEGISGTSTKKREGFNRMISDAENGVIDLILTKEVSRFARNTVDTLSITRSLKKLGVYVIFVNDHINTADKDGELRLSLMATIAQDESRKTSERVKWGQKRRMEQGIVFGRDMLGYSVKNGVLHLKENEAEIVRLIFHKYTNEGKGTHVIARELREAGVHPLRVKEWSNVVILRVLRNEKYVGDLCQKKTYTPDYLDHAKKYNRGAEEKVYIRDHHPDIAIIDRDLWDRTQAELQRRSPSEEQKSKHSNRYWCSGKLICGDCGGAVVSRTKKLRDGSILKSWKCHKSAMHGQRKLDPAGNLIGCTGKSINDRTLRQLTAYAINMIAVDKDSLRKKLLQNIQGLLGERSQSLNKKQLQAEIEKLQQKKLRIIDLAAEGMISKEDLKAQNDFYTQKIEKTTERLLEAEHQAAEQRAQQKRMQTYIDRIDELLHFDASNEKTMCEALKKAVIYSDNRVDLYLSGIPFGIRMSYQTKGRQKTFGIDVLSCEVIEASPT